MVFAGQAAPERVADRGAEMLGAKVALGAVGDRPQRAGDNESLALLDLGFRNPTPMDDAASREALPKSARNGQVDLPRHQVAKLVQRERSVVGDDRLDDPGPVAAP